MQPGAVIAATIEAATTTAQSILPARMTRLSHTRRISFRQTAHDAVTGKTVIRSTTRTGNDSGTQGIKLAVVFRAHLADQCHRPQSGTCNRHIPPPKPRQTCKQASEFRQRGEEERLPALFCHADQMLSVVAQFGLMMQPLSGVKHKVLRSYLQAEENA